MTISDLKNYVINEAKKLVRVEVLKEEKKRIESLLSEIDKKTMNAAKDDIRKDGGKFEPLGSNKFEKNLDKAALKKAMSPEINETESNLEVKEFRFKVKHDSGSETIKTTASSLEAAKKKIMSSKGCPESAITSI